jgi:hypothetical protein
LEKFGALSVTSNDPLCGRFVVELDGRRIGRELPSRQGRLLFAYLALNRGRAVSRDELLEARWPYAIPAAAPSALGVPLSKLRAAVGPPMLSGRGELRLTLPPDTRVGVEDALAAVHEAQSAVARSRKHTAACSVSPPHRAEIARPKLARQTHHRCRTSSGARSGTRRILSVTALSSRPARDLPHPRRARQPADTGVARGLAQSPRPNHPDSRRPRGCSRPRSGSRIGAHSGRQGCCSRTEAATLLEREATRLPTIAFVLRSSRSLRSPWRQSERPAGAPAPQRAPSSTSIRCKS